MSKRFWALVTDVVLLIWSGLKFLLEAIGAATVVEDAKSMVDHIQNALVWLTGVSWYWPLVFAFFLTVWLVYLTWKESHSKNGSDNEKMTPIYEHEELPTATDHVISINQSGGITAKNVNIGRREFRFDEVLKQKLIDVMENAKVVSFEMIGDHRAESLGREIWFIAEKMGKKLGEKRRISLYITDDQEYIQPLFWRRDGDTLWIIINTQAW